MLIFVPSISAETCIETPPWTKHQMVGNESHVLTAAKAKRAVFILAALCAVIQQGINGLEITSKYPKSDITLHLVQIA